MIDRSNLTHRDVLRVSQPGQRWRELRHEDASDCFTNYLRPKTRTDAADLTD